MIFLFCDMHNFYSYYLLTKNKYYGFGLFYLFGVLLIKCNIKTVKGDDFSFCFQSTGLVM